jgi:hypothetical protein
MAAPSTPTRGIFSGTPSSVPDSQTVRAVASQEVTSFAYADINAAFAVWQAAETKRMTARKSYDDAVIAGLDLSYSAQLVHNQANAAATQARTDYYTMVSAYKKQLRNRVAS